MEIGFDHGGMRRPDGLPGLSETAEMCFRKYDCVAFDPHSTRPSLPKTKVMLQATACVLTPIAYIVLGYLCYLVHN